MVQAWASEAGEQLNKEKVIWGDSYQSPGAEWQTTQLMEEECVGKTLRKCQ